MLRKGETVTCPPNVAHWHGAAHGSWFVQLAMTQEHPDGRVRWEGPVDEATYREGIEAERSTMSSEKLTLARYRSIATVAGLLASDHYDALGPALEDALDAGLTVNECKEVFVHLYAYVGFPRSIQGLRALMATVADRRDRCPDRYFRGGTHAIGTSRNCKAAGIDRSSAHRNRTGF